MKLFGRDNILFIALAVLLALHYVSLIPQAIDQPLLVLLSALATVPVFWSAAKSVKKGKVSVDLLASVALGMSLLTKQWTSAAFINLMLTCARIFGNYTESKARAAIQGLLKLRPQNVKIKRGSEIIEKSFEEVIIGDLVIIESGGRIPIDGTILQGEASVDQSSLTGESAPIAKKPGDKVFSSTLAVSGSLIVKAEKIGKDTTLEKIISLVEESQKEKSETKTIADKFAGWYIAATLLGSLLIYYFFHDVNLVLSILLVTCADDIAVAVPLAFFSAIGYAARRGVIIKGGNFLEALTKVKTMIVDKTGTLTMGSFEVQKIVPCNEYNAEDVLKIAASTEFFSEHPAAKAILTYAHSKNLSFEKPDDFEEKPGRGTVASFGGKKFFSGNLNFFREMEIALDSSEFRTMKEYEEKGFDVTLIGVDSTLSTGYPRPELESNAGQANSFEKPRGRSQHGEKKLVGLVVLADKIRPKIKEAIAKLRKFGITHWVMLTGDNEKVAGRVATELNIGEFHANLLPEQKVDYIKRHLAKHPKTAMIGDGVNDAASLALADVGIAMGVIGSDAAIEAADIALMKDDISEIPEIVELGHYTLRIAHQDFLIWGVTNFLGLALASLHIIGPEGAAAYNFITDFFPLINSLRLFNLHRTINPMRNRGGS